jgi:adenylate kinase family enzyme
MDQLFWKPGWQESSDDELFRKVREVTAQPRWVLDGNYTRTTPDKWKHVQLVIWLDLPFARTVFRVTKRAIHRSLTQRELWPGTGNRESLTKAFLSKDSVIWWAITTHRRNRQKYSAVMAARNLRTSSSAIEVAGDGGVVPRGFAARRVFLMQSPHRPAILKSTTVPPPQ